MTEDTESKYPNLIEKAERHCQQLERENKPIALTCLSAGVALIVLLVTFYIEIANFTLGLRALFPPLSSGDKYGPLVASLGIATALVLVLGHVLLKQASGALGRWFDKSLVILGIISLAMLVVGAMLFLPASVGQATGIGQTNQANGVATTGAAISLGIVLSALFPISILSNNIVLGWLTSALDTLEKVRARRKQIQLRREMIDEIERNGSMIEGFDAAIADRSRLQNGETALKRDVATEIATVVGQVATHFNAVLLTREAMAAAPKDAVLQTDLTPTQLLLPIEKLREMTANLTSFTPETVFKMLSAREV